MSDHTHEWKLPEGGFFVIATYPEQLPYGCKCGAFTHDPETGVPCQMCAPEDYARRGPTIRLSGGPFNGKTITRPLNRSVLLRCDGDGKRVQKIVKYEQTEDAGVWEFMWNDWTHCFEERA